MFIVRRLSALLDIRPDENRLVGMVMMYGLVLEFSRALAAAISTTLFLTQFSATSIAYVYMGSAVTIPLTGLVYLRLQSRIALPRLIAYTLLMLALSLLGFRTLLAASSAPWIAVALLIWFTVLYVLVILSFWNLNARLFNLRQGKRLFGLLNAGMESGQAIGGLLMPLLVLVLGVNNVLVVAALGFGGALGLEMAITRRYFRADAHEPGTADVTTSPGGAFSSRYVRLMLVLVVLAYLSYLYLDTIVFSLAQRYYQTADQIANLVGITMGITSLLTILGQVLISGPFSKRYGVKVGVVVLPVLVTIGTLVIATTGTLLGPVLLVFWISHITRMTDRAIRFSIDEVSLQIMYQPLLAAQRSIVQTVAEGGMKPLAGGLAGVSIVLFTRGLGFDAVDLTYVLLAVALTWVIVALLLAREYPARLSKALASRQLSGTTLALNDGDSLSLLRAHLGSAHVGEVLYALELLEDLPGAELEAAFVRLLEHPEAAIRRDVAARIERLRMLALAPRLYDRLAVEDDPLVQAALLRTIGALNDERATDLLESYVAHADPRVRHGALLGLVRGGDVEGMLIATEWLTTQVRSTDPERRALAARFMGEAALPGFQRTLVPLLYDDDHAVRRAAITAAGRLKHVQLWPGVLAAIDQSEFRADAATALAAGGPTVMPLLWAALERTGQDSATRAVLVRVLGRIGGADVAPPLLALLDSRDEHLRGTVLAALQGRGYGARAATETALIQRQIDIETERAAHLLASVRDLGVLDPTALLRDALDYRLANVRDRILSLLAMVYDAPTVHQVQRSYRSSSAEQRAYGLELLDLLLPSPVKATLLPLLEDIPGAQQLARLERRFPQPRLETVQRLELLRVDADDRCDNWISLCVRYALQLLRAADQPTSTAEETAMPSLLERVLVLKTVHIFADIPDEILADIAVRLVEVPLRAGTTLFEKGATGESVYIIDWGKLRVHDGDHTLNDLNARDVVGEMAVLNSAPRVASVTAVEDSGLLRLDQDTLFAVMADHPVVMREIVRTLSVYLQNCLQQIEDMDARLRSLDGVPA